MFAMFDSDSTAPRKVYQRVAEDVAACEAFSQQAQSTPEGNVSLNLTIPAEPVSPLSTSSAFLVGIHNYQALDDINLPDFVREHHATLTFPEKVSL
jgi:hypothetical protein